MRLVFRLSRYNRYSFIPLFAIVKRQGFEPLLAESFSEVCELSPDVIFYSFMTPNRGEVYKELTRLKERFPKVLAVAGGPHPSAMPGEVLSCGFDAVVVGEAEQVMERLLKDILAGRCSGVYRGEKVPEINYSLSFSPYTGPIELVRGCPFGCTFCQVSHLFGRRPRYRSLESVFREAKVLIERGRRFVRFLAPNALSYMSPDGKTPNLEILKRLFEGLKALGVEQIFFGSFPSEIRPDSVTYEAVELMSRYCANKRVVVGAQSGSDERLRILKRGHSVSDVERAVQILHSFGFLVHLDFIFGFPGETEVELVDTLNFIERLLAKYRVKIHAHTFIPLPGTPLWGSTPSEIPKWVKRVLHDWERAGLLDGNWAQQEYMRRVM